MEVLRVGSAPPRVLVVPGNDLPAPFYRPFADELAAGGLGVLLGDWPGFGAAASAATPDFDRLIEDVLATVPRPGVLIGHSFGGLIALLCAARRPEALTHLVLLEPAIFPTRFIAKLAARRYIDEVIRGDRSVFTNHNGLSRRAHAPERYPKAMIDLHLDLRGKTDPGWAEALFEQLPGLYPLPYDRVKVPVLLVSGGEIGLLARTMRLGLIRHLRPRHEVLAGAAHWLVNEDDERLARLVAEFLGPH